MDDEVELYADEHGVAVIGNPAAIEEYLFSAGIATSRAMDMGRLRGALSAGSAASQTAALIAENSGRWVKLTQESADKLKKYQAMNGSSSSVSRAILTDKGKAKHILEFARKPSGVLSNPAVLSGAAGLMAQLAMQQAMDEITDYLAAIDAKVDDVLRAQKDAAVAQMIGVAFVIDEAMVLREARGRVDDVICSKVQGAAETIATTQAYALRQLDAIADKLDKTSRMAELASVAQKAESEVQEWLGALARCFQLLDALAVIELDRVLDGSPDDLDKHRLGLAKARERRLSGITDTTHQLLAHMDSSAARANAKVLFNPIDSRHVVTASNHVGSHISGFHSALGIETGRADVPAVGWSEAAVQVKDRARLASEEGLESVKRVGTEGLERARSTTGKLSKGVIDRGIGLGRRVRGE